MRMHIELDDELVREVDDVAGPRGRTAFVRRAIVVALAHAQRSDALREVAGALADSQHEWDDDPAAWVRESRNDSRRAG